VVLPVTIPTQDAQSRAVALISNTAQRWREPCSGTPHADSIPASASWPLPARNGQCTAIPRERPTRSASAARRSLGAAYWSIPIPTCASPTRRVDARRAARLRRSTRIRQRLQTRNTEASSLCGRVIGPQVQLQLLRGSLRTHHASGAVLQVTGNQRMSTKAYALTVE